jgi:predicted outer membrane lipoprotein
MSLLNSIIIGLLIITNMAEDFSPDRQLFIFGKEENQLLVQQQLQLLDESADGVKERSVKIKVVDKGSALYRSYNVKRGEFTVILIGKDGIEKYRTNKVLQPAALFAIIDAMPMRQTEMKKKKVE